MVHHTFQKWEDGTTNPTRNTLIVGPATFKAYYAQVNHVANVEFVGQVSAQDAPGKTVMLAVTKPDDTIDFLTAITGVTGDFILTKQYLVAGQYSVVPSISADSQYQAVVGASVPFVIGLLPRTLTVAVNVT